MTRDNAKPAPPPGTLLAALALIAGAVVGAVIAVGHSSTENLILGSVICLGCAVLGFGLLYAWFKGRKQS